MRENNSFVREVLNDFCYFGTRKLFIIVTKMFCPISVEGLENLQALKSMAGCPGIIITANHVSRLDPWIIAGIYPKLIHFLAAKDLLEVDKQCLDYSSIFKTKWSAKTMAILTKFIVANSHTIIVDRDSNNSKVNRSAIREVKKILKEGGAICIFPQKGINRQEKGKIAVTLARQTGATLLSIHLEKKPDSWGRKSHWEASILKPISGDKIDNNKDTLR